MKIQSKKILIALSLMTAFFGCSDSTLPTLEDSFSLNYTGGFTEFTRTGYLFIEKSSRELTYIMEYDNVECEGVFTVTENGLDSFLDTLQNISFTSFRNETQIIDEEKNYIEVDSIPYQIGNCTNDISCNQISSDDACLIKNHLTDFFTGFDLSSCPEEVRAILLDC